MQAVEVAPSDMQCKDKFLLQSIVVRPGSTTKDITSDMVTNNKLFLDGVFYKHCIF